VACARPDLVSINPLLLSCLPCQRSSWLRNPNLQLRLADEAIKPPHAHYDSNDDTSICTSIVIPSLGLRCSRSPHSEHSPSHHGPVTSHNTNHNYITLHHPGILHGHYDTSVSIVQHIFSNSSSLSTYPLVLLTGGRCIYPFSFQSIHH